MSVKACTVLLMCGLSSLPATAATQLDLSKIENRRQVLAERKGTDCAGIYKQTQLKLDAMVKLAGKLEASAGLTPQTLVQLNAMTTALGQKRREFCELYKSTPEWNAEEYFRAYGEMSKLESDIDTFLKTMAGEAGKPQGEAQKVSALAGRLATVSVSADDTIQAVAERLRTRVELAGFPSTPAPELAELLLEARRHNLMAERVERLALREPWAFEGVERLRRFSTFELVLSGLLGALVSFGALRLLSHRKGQ